MCSNLSLNSCPDLQVGHHYRICKETNTPHHQTWGLVASLKLVWLLLIFSPFERLNLLNIWFKFISTLVPLWCWRVQRQEFDQSGAGQWEDVPTVVRSRGALVCVAWSLVTWDTGKHETHIGSLTDKGLRVSNLLGARTRLVHTLYHGLTDCATPPDKNT